MLAYLHRIQSKIRRSNLAKFTVLAITVFAGFSILFLNKLPSQFQKPAPSITSPRVAGVATQTPLDSCRFTRSGVSDTYKSSLLLQWLTEGGTEKGVPPAILASIARHESPELTTSDDNDNAIKTNHYCNFGTDLGWTRPVGLMQVQSFHYPGADLCNIQFNIRAGAEVFKATPGLSFDNPDENQVKLAVCNYFGDPKKTSCRYPWPTYQHDYAAEVWNDYQKCSNNAPPAEGSVQADITGLAGINGGHASSSRGGAYVASGPVKITAQATATAGNKIDDVTLRADNQSFADVKNPPPTVEVTTDTRLLPDGPHTLTEVAKDNVGHTGSDTVQVTTDNKKPSVSIAEPVGSGPFSGQVRLRANVSDSTSGIQVVVFLLDGAEFDRAIDPPYQVLGDSTKTTNGWHTLAMRAYDNAGNYDSASKQVLVQNVGSLHPDTVEIKSPQAGALPAGWAWFKVDASDQDSGIQKVEFYVNGTRLATDYDNTDDPQGYYAYEWHSGDPPYGPGNYNLIARAYDNAGNYRDSSIDVTIPQPQVCTPGSYNKRCSGNCSGCAANAGEQVVKQCNSSGTGWDPEYGQCSTDCAGPCGVQQPVEPQPTSIPGHGGTPPNVTITSPASSNRIWSGVPLTISAAVQDTGSGVKQVEFYYENQLISNCTRTSAPYSCVYTPSNVGFLSTKTIGVKAYDKANNSRLVTVQVSTWW